MYLTQQKIIDMQIAQGARKSDSEIFLELIKEHRESEHVREALEGDMYFTVDNIAILEHDFTSYHDSWGVLHSSKTDENLKDKANNLVPAGFARKHVLEKAAYLVKNEINISHKTAPAEVDKFKDALGRKFHQVVNKIVEDASNRGRAWVHFFLDGSRFGLMTMHTCWIIPVYETSRQERLVRVIRYYPVELDTAGDKEQKYHLEDWNESGVVFYEQQDGNNFMEVGRSGHFGFKDERTGNPIMDPDGNRVTGSWGRVPFLEIKNNNQAISDLHLIKRAVDAYDMQVSLFCNDLEDIKQMIIKAIGTSEDPAVLADSLKKFGIVTLEPGLSGEGKQDVDYLRLDTPYLAKRDLLDKLEKVISYTGMSLDFDLEKYGDPSGVALRFLYAPLDLKAGLLESKLKLSLYDVFWFVNRYLSITEGGALSDADLEKFEFTFDKYMITNEQEGARLANESKGCISEQTRLSNDPRVDDVQEEMKRMQEEEAKRIEDFEQSLLRRQNGDVTAENVN